MAAASDIAWAKLEAPGIEDIETMAERAFARLPKTFRSLCEGVIIRVVDFPTEDVLQELGAQSEFDILGLFQGVGLAQDGGGPRSGQLPNIVFLYRRPILDYWAEHHETLGALVTHVLVHEIGHHFGLSDADMDKIVAGAGA
jgi:predicted Zn-dependent protease with MMP-like domain